MIAIYTLIRQCSGKQCVKQIKISEHWITLTDAFVSKN